MEPPAKAVLLIILLLLIACSENPPLREIKVGRDFLKYSDSGRKSWNSNEDRPLATTIWYPTVKTAIEELWQVGVFTAGWSAPGSDVLENGAPYPLIVLSHGTGGAALQLSWLAEHLASNGYIVAAVNHHGNTAFEESLLPQGFVLWWERTRDLSVVIDKLLVDRRFGKLIDQERIGLAGFSLGGYTVISALGGITDLKKKEEFCVKNSSSSLCELPPEAKFTISDLRANLENDTQTLESLRRAGKSYKDNRVKAIFSIAPVHGPAFTEESLTKISSPVALLVGDADKQAPAKNNAKKLANSIAGSLYEELPNVSHYTFLSRCNAKGRQFVKQLCNDQGGVKREEVHSLVASKALSFFDQSL